MNDTPLITASEALKQTAQNVVEFYHKEIEIVRNAINTSIKQGQRHCEIPISTNANVINLLDSRGYGFEYRFDERVIRISW